MWPAQWRPKEEPDLDIPLSFSLNFFFFCKSGWLWHHLPKRIIIILPRVCVHAGGIHWFFPVIASSPPFFFLFIKTLERISSPERPEMVTQHFRFFFSRVRIATNWKRMCHVYNLEATLYTQLYNCISNKKCPVMDIGVSSLHLASSSIEPHPHTRRLIQLRTCRGKMAESIGGKNQRFYRRDNTSIG